MSPFIIYSDLSTYTTVSGSAAYSGSYNYTNIKSYENTDIWQSDVTTNAQSLYVDFGSNQTFDSWVIDNNNFSSLGCSAIYVIAADNAGLTTNAAVAGTNDIQSSGSLFYNTFTAITRRYWGIRFFGAQSVKPYIGNFFFSSKLTFSSPQDWGYKGENREYVTSEVVSLSGRIMTSQNYAGRIIDEHKFTLQTDTVADNFRTFQSTVRGKLRPFYYVDADNTIRYMHLTDDYTPVESVRYNINTINLKMRTHVSTY